MEKETESILSNQSAEKAMFVLEALARQKHPIKLGDLSRETKMNSSTLYRFLVALQNTGYVVQHKASGEYELNLKLCYLSDLIKSHFSISNVLHPFVSEASALFQESAHLAQEDKHSIIYIDNVVSSSQSLVIRQYIGKSAPMHCTGIGKLFLSERSDDEIDFFIEKVGIPSYTEHTLSTGEFLKKELQMIRERGYSLDNEECELGVRCVAVPIRDHTGKIAVGLSISGPASRITQTFVDSNLPVLLNIAERASFELGYAREICNNRCLGKDN